MAVLRNFATLVTQGNLSGFNEDFKSYLLGKLRKLSS
jgi:hypothetical protein